MKKPNNKDIFRSIWNSKKRFVAILVITALGVTVFTGIYATCRDMYHSADHFYDSQQLFDIRILSTLGLTEDDVESLQTVTGIEVADGAYSETVHTDVGGIRQSVDMTVLSEKGLNLPYVLAGKLPSAPGEIAVTQEYISASGKALGDTLTIDETLEETRALITAEDEIALDELGLDTDAEPDTPTFLNTTYTITSIVLDPMNITNRSEGSSYRSISVTDYTFFVSAADADYDVYTSVYVRLAGLSALNCFSAEYEETVDVVIDLIETLIMEQREQARYRDILSEGYREIADAEAAINEKFDEVDGELAGAHTDIRSGKQDLIDAEAIIAEGETALIAGEQKLEAAREEYEAQRQDALDQFAQMDQAIGSIETLLAQGETTLNDQIADLQARVTPWPQLEWDALVAAAARETGAVIGDMDLPDFGLDSGEIVIPDGWLDDVDLSAILAIDANTQAEQEALCAAVLATGADTDTADECVRAAMAFGARQPVRDTMNAQIAAYQTQKDDALRQLAEAEALLIEAQEALELARRELDAGRAEVEQGWIDLAAGEAELYANEQAYIDQKALAVQKIREAYAEMSTIDMTQWYVQGRASLDSYAGLKSDMSSIETIGNVFPIIFLVVAVLISLTTMTRMVEEDRGLIGTYKALGFSDAAIYKKYLLYALLACLLGGLIGDLLGFIALPLFLFTILRTLYTLPQYLLQFNLLYGIGGVVLFTASIVGATALACRSELKQLPAPLMRPKAPKAGSRVFLERIPAIWNRLKFLNKVTLRNLFRYKKRLLMTVAGIMGCTALVLVGFAIKDSVTDLMPKQYEHIYQYDLMAVVDADDYTKLQDRMDRDDNIEDYMGLQLVSAKVIHENGDGESVQLLVIPEGAGLDDYIQMLDTSGAAVTLDDTGVLLTQNAAEILRLSRGDAAKLQNLQLDRYEVSIAGIVENYLGNNVFISQALYESLFGDYEANAVLAHFSSACADQTAYAEKLLEDDMILSSVSTEALKSDFSANFSLINSVVYILILLAAALAFVVLFTLSNTNISERERELATIKVLGFYDGEVHSYVNKETIILTLIGIVAGMPLGRIFGELLGVALKMPSIHFAVSIHPISYLIAAVISFSFALIVNFITDRSLDRINMVEALKSVE